MQSPAFILFIRLCRTGKNSGVRLARRIFGWPIWLAIGCWLYPANSLEGATTTASEANEKLPAVIKGSVVNVRAKPSLTGEVLTQLRRGDTVTVLNYQKPGAAKSGDTLQWSRIQCPDAIKVWVKAVYLKDGTVTASRLNLRNGKGENFGLIGQLNRGEKVDILKTEDGWAQIRPPSTVPAYIASEYLELITKPLVKAELNAPPPTNAPANGVGATLPARPTTPIPETIPRITQTPTNLVAPAPIQTPSSNPISALPTNLPVARTPLASSTNEPSANLDRQKPVITPSPAVSPSASTRQSADSSGSRTNLNVIPAVTHEVKAQAPGPAEMNPSSPTAPPLNLTAVSPDTQLKNHVAVSYRMGMNVTARFYNFGGLPVLNNPGMGLGSGVNRTYDDGFNASDSRTVADGLTWNWGYKNAAQISANDTLLMHSMASSVISSVSDPLDQGAWQHGFELAFSRQWLETGVAGQGQLGFEAAFNYTALNFQNQVSGSAPLTRLTDAYTLGGVLPPLAPYAGSFFGPGPLIGDTPNRTITTVPDAVVVSEHRTLDASMFGFRLGPYYELPLFQRIHLSLNGGLSLAWIDSDFRYQESAQIAGLGTVNYSGSDSRAALLPGFYLGGGLSVNLSRSVSLIYNLQFQHLSDFWHQVDNRKVRLDLEQSLFQSIGLRYSF